jgi:trehalose-phosphatase
LARIRIDGIDAVIFDMDGVITDTASVHAAAWKRLFDDFLRERSEREGEPFVPFDADADYRTFVDGRPRYDGVRGFLASRGISLPEGDPADPPDRETICGLGNRKNEYFLAHLREHGVEAFPTTLAFVRQLVAAGLGTAAVSASRNMQDVLQAAGVRHLFEVGVDGRVSEDLGIPGKPDPAMFLEAARRLGVEPARAAVVEDALSGVEAGRRGGFGLVIGVDRTRHPGALTEAGADVVVSDLGEVEVVSGPGDAPVEPAQPAVGDLPSALERASEIAGLIAGRKPAVFLDYDGTLTPIVERPEDALLPVETRAVVARLAALLPVAILSGRDLPDVRAMVGVDGIVYAGSHGFDIERADGGRDQRGREFLPELDAAERELRPFVEAVPGARVERKAFAIAVHFRQVREDRVDEVADAVRRVAAEHPRLRTTGGKKILELRPSLEWDKGRALQWLLEVLGLDEPGVVPVYVGDDETDEDAFRAVRNRGVGVVVRGEADERPTAARYALRDTTEVREFLDGLTAGFGSAR